MTMIIGLALTWSAAFSIVAIEAWPTGWLPLHRNEPYGLPLPSPAEQRSMVLKLNSRLVQCLIMCLAYSQHDSLFLTSFSLPHYGYSNWWTLLLAVCHLSIFEFFQEMQYNLRVHSGTIVPDRG